MIIDVTVLGIESRIFEFRLCTFFYDLHVFVGAIFRVFAHGDVSQTPRIRRVLDRNDVVLKGELYVRIFGLARRVNAGRRGKAVENVEVRTALVRVMVAAPIGLRCFGRSGAADQHRGKQNRAEAQPASSGRR